MMHFSHVAGDLYSPVARSKVVGLSWRAQNMTSGSWPAGMCTASVIDVWME